jgi:hypothetical protein
VLAWILQQGHAEEAGSSLANTNTSLSSARRNVEIGRKKKPSILLHRTWLLVVNRKTGHFHFFSIFKATFSASKLIIKYEDPFHIWNYTEFFFIGNKSTKTFGKTSPFAGLFG